MREKQIAEEINGCACLLLMLCTCQLVRLLDRQLMKLSNQTTIIIAIPSLSIAAGGQQ